MNYDKLKTELAKPAYAELSDAEAADLLNAKTIDSTQPIPSAELLAWSGQAGRFVRIVRAAGDVELSDELRSIAGAALELIRRDDTSLDLSLYDRVAMLDILVKDQVLTADDEKSLRKLAAVKISRAEELGLPYIDVGNITAARS